MRHCHRTAIHRGPKPPHAAILASLSRSWAGDGGPGPLPVVFLRFQKSAGTGDTKPIAGSYDVDAAFMSFQLHDGGIHAVRAGA
jgi:hypothetical protein